MLGMLPLDAGLGTLWIFTNCSDLPDIRCEPGVMCSCTALPCPGLPSWFIRGTDVRSLFLLICFGADLHSLEIVSYGSS